MQMYKSAVLMHDLLRRNEEEVSSYTSDADGEKFLPEMLCMNLLDNNSREKYSKKNTNYKYENWLEWISKEYKWYGSKKICIGKHCVPYHVDDFIKDIEQNNTCRVYFECSKELLTNFSCKYKYAYTNDS